MDINVLSKPKRKEATIDSRKSKILGKTSNRFKKIKNVRQNKCDSN